MSTMSSPSMESDGADDRAPQASTGLAARACASTGKTIWIDLDNSPHVPFFLPIVRALEARGHRVVVTARDCFQVGPLAERMGLPHKLIGRHYGANIAAKALGLVWRTLQLAPSVIRARPDLSLSHGSRSLVLLSSILRIPSILLFDYEHAAIIPMFKAEIGLAPSVIRDPALGRKFRGGLASYSGIKEDVYVGSHRPHDGFLRELDVAPEHVLATIRPPASEAHYHRPESDALFADVVEFLGRFDNVRMVILPRNDKTQRPMIRERWPQWCAERRIIIPDRVLNGLDLIWHSDFVVSGGGTMNREAAAMGVPVYSIFRGALGAVDRYLSDTGRLTLIQHRDDIATTINVAKRTRGATATSAPALSEIVATVEELLAA